MSPILHQKIPSSVRQLDALLNRRVVEAGSEHEVNRWLTTKLRLKRRLVCVPAHMIDAAASAAIAELRGRL